MKKLYVVAKGKKPGIYESWAECEAQVKGFKSAKHKSFKTRPEAEKFYEEFRDKTENDNIKQETRLTDGFITEVETSTAFEREEETLLAFTEFEGKNSEFRAINHMKREFSEDKTDEIPKKNIKM
jgi:ribonuclease HI